MEPVTTRKWWLVGCATSALGIYSLLWFGVAAQWQWIDTMDRSGLDPLLDFATAHPGWVVFWDWFCLVLGPFAFRLVGLVVIVVALARRKVRMAMFLVISVELSGLITEAAKAAANRSRPEGALVSALSTSFPSGHALGVIVGVLAFLTLALPLVHGAPASLADRSRRDHRAHDRLRAGGTQRASSVRRLGRMGTRLRLVRRLRIGDAARRADHAAADKDRQRPVVHLEPGHIAFGADLAVMRELGAPVHGGEGELRHPHLVVERAAGQPGRGPVN